SSLDLPTFVGQVAAAVTGYRARSLRPRALFERLLKVTDQDFGNEPAVRENNRGDVPFQKRRRNVLRFVNVRSPDSELAVHDRWIVEKQMLLSFSCAALADEFERRAGQALGKLPGI